MSSENETSVVGAAAAVEVSDSHADHNQHDHPKHREHPALHLIGPAYARNKSFWISIIFSTIPQGLFMALVALAFFNVFELLSEATWLTHDYEASLHTAPSGAEGGGTDSGGTEEDVGAHSDSEHGGSGNIDMLRVGNGSWIYVGMLAGAGLCVGLIKVIWTYLLAKRHPFPDKPPSMIQELAELRAHDPLICIPAICCSAIGIGLGVSTGPEAALGCVGTSVGSGFVAKRRQIWQGLIHKLRRKNRPLLSPVSPTNERDDEGDKDAGELAPYLFPDLSSDEQMCALDGMSAAFGALFPAQYLSPMMLHEIGFLWGPEGAQSTYHFMETVVRTGVASSVAYALFVGLQDRTFLEQAVLPQAAYELLPTIEIVHLFDAAVLGIICGALGLLGILFLGVGNALGGKCNEILNRLGSTIGLPELFLGMLLNPVVGGTLLGLIAKGVPLTLGDGAHQLGFVITHGTDLGAGDLLASMFAKLACVAIALGFGFVGGQIFPLIFAGACLGSLAHLWVPQVPLVVSVTTCMCAVPCAFMPALFTFTTLVSMVIALGGAGTTPIFVAAITSYTTVCGLGVVQDLMAKAAGDEPASEDSTNLPVSTNKKEDSEKNDASSGIEDIKEDSGGAVEGA